MNRKYRMLSILNSKVSLFAKKVEEKYETKGIEKIWTTSKIKTAKPRTKTEVISGSKCEHIWTRSAKKQGACGDPVCKDSVTGKYCKKHLNDEKTKKKKDDTNIVKQLNENKSVTHVSRNSYGNYEEKDTHLLFNTDHYVYGKQVGDKVESLSDADIELCKMKTWKYIVPKTIKSDEKTDTKEQGNILSDEDDMSADEDSDE